MRLIMLNKEQLAEIYRTKMVNDFPPMELKPLDRMFEAYDKGNYACYAMINDVGSIMINDVGPAMINDAEEVLGYALFVKMDNHYLFDYFAVNNDRRNEGLGSSFLELIHAEFKDSDSVIGEVEDPEFAQNEADRVLQNRRLHFYLRNGYINTGIKVRMFDVDYIVLEMDLGKNNDKDRIADLYLAHYKAMLPDELFRQKVMVK